MLSVALVITSEKVTDTEEFSAIPLSPFGGDVSETLGGVVLSRPPEVLPNRSPIVGDSSPPPPQLTRLALASVAVANKRLLNILNLMVVIHIR